MAMVVRLCATMSWSSRAMRSRSSAAAWRDSASRSRSRNSARSRSAAHRVRRSATTNPTIPPTRVTTTIGSASANRRRSRPTCASSSAATTTIAAAAPTSAVRRVAWTIVEYRATHNPNGADGPNTTWATTHAADTTRSTTAGRRRRQSNGTLWTSTRASQTAPSRIDVRCSGAPGPICGLSRWSKATAATSSQSPSGWFRPGRPRLPARVTPAVSCMTSSCSPRPARARVSSPARRSRSPYARSSAANSNQTLRASTPRESSKQTVGSSHSCSPWTVSVARARGHFADHYAVALALGPVVGEALALVHRACAVVEERRVLLPDPAGVVRVALDQAAAGPRDQLDAAQGDRRQAVAAKAPLDQDAGDPVVGQSLGSGDVLLAVLDVEQLLGRPILRPGVTPAGADRGGRSDGRDPAPEPVVTQVMKEAGLPSGKPASDLLWSLGDSNP